ncbi:MAG TPA: SAM-dependent methyltransferase, partial [Cupriavidus sp.]|nr:SAM-dependent methyltransferase [Cupriavidus sp.]
MPVTIHRCRPSTIAAMFANSRTISSAQSDI